MRLGFAVFLIAISAAAQNRSTPIAPACGPQGTTFGVQMSGVNGAPVQPDSKNAQVFFIQDDGPGGDHQHYTLRIGLDGKWVGAYKQNAYFSVFVEPGEHHVCANIQSNSKLGRYAVLAHFVAERGKTYYFRTQFLGGLNTEYPTYPYLILDNPDSDQAVFLIKALPQVQIVPLN